MTTVTKIPIHLQPYLELAPLSLKNASNELIQFTQIRYKRETFTITPADKNYKVVNDSIIANPGKENFACDLNHEVVSSNSAYSLALETCTSSCPWIKGINRVVLVDQVGRRVFDTLVKMQELPKGEKYMIKDGLKKNMVEFANAEAPELPVVVKVLDHLISDKVLVGYHLPLKLNDLGVFEKMHKQQIQAQSIIEKKFAGANATPEGILEAHQKLPGSFISNFDNLFDIAKVFNRDQSQIQIPFDILCLKELNMIHKRRPYPFVYTEAKISMALYQRWQALKSGTCSQGFEKKEVIATIPEEPYVSEFAVDDEECDKENAVPNNQASVQLALDFSDRDKPVEIKSEGLIRFLVEASVKQHFRQQYSRKMIRALE